MLEQAENEIRDAIARRGRITFAEFMRLTLYGPGGYYTSGSPISAAGDYFTSPSAHPAFGALITVQLRDMWQMLGSPDTFTVVEEAAGNGGLAADITEYAVRLDKEFASALDYRALDISPPPRQHFPVAPRDRRPAGITGCLLSNELLDAMPVHRFEVSNGEVQEIFIGLNDDHLVELLHAPSSPEIADRVQPFLSVLPDGYRGEVNTGLARWAAQQAETLDTGWLLAVDYGFDRHTLYKPERMGGSLRCYNQHTLGQDPLRDIGRQDITAHVDFTAVDESLKTNGFKRTGTVIQRDFLANLGMTSLMQKLQETAMPLTVRRKQEAGMQSLVDPAGMGGFLVAAYGRNAPQEPLRGVYGPQNPYDHALPLPMAVPGRHIDLAGAQQGAGYFEVPSFDHLFSDEP
ncbi:MAG: SAM-dependent methyltransferase [Chloroflexi bacterium]|nr:SAM-dependent methyltransferase [Chloroflexota bacterium]